MTKVTCVIPAWNAERFIAAAVASVQAQTYPVDEIIVIDDGSTDATAEVVAGLSGVTMIRQANAGYGGARDSGIKAARGEFLAFIDADDLWEPTKIAVQMAAFEADLDLDLCFGSVEHRDIRIQGPDTLPIKLPVGIVPGRLIATMLARTASFRRVGLIGGASKTASEQEWLLKARDMGLKEVSLPDLTYIRQVHGENMTIRLSKEKREDYRAILEKVLRERRASGKVVQPTALWSAHGKHD